MPYATAADVDRRWDEPSFLDDPVMVAHVDALLEEAEFFLGQRVPDLAFRLAEGTTKAQGVKLVLINAVIRLLNNPKGYQTESAGESSFSYPSVSGGISNDISFGPRDLALLGIRNNRTLSVKMGVPESRRHITGRYGHHHGLEGECW